jgi:hypothetical protein
MALRRPLPVRLSRRLCAGTTALLAVAALAAVPFAYDAYYQGRLAASPQRPLVQALAASAAPGARLVIGGAQADGVQEVFDGAYAFLQRRFDVTSVQTDDYYPDWQPRLAQAAQGHTQTWIYAPPDSPLHAWMAAHYPALSSQDLDGWRLSAWDTR